MRLVARKFWQQSNVDFTKTYSPAKRFDTMRVLCIRKFNLAQGDIKNAFFQSDLNEDMYTKQPTSYEDGTGCF